MTDKEKEKRNYHAEDSKEELLEIYHKVLRGEKILKQQVEESTYKNTGMVRKVKNIYYSREEAAQGIRKILGLDIEKQQIKVEGDLAQKIMDARKRKKGDKD